MKDRRTGTDGRRHWLAAFAAFLLLVSTVPLLRPATGVGAVEDGGVSLLEASQVAREESEGHLAWLVGSEAVEQRERSRTAFDALSSLEAKSLLLGTFPEQLRALNADPARVLSELEIEKPLGTYGALISTSEEGTAIVESTVPVQSNLGGDGNEPVELALEPSGSAYVPQNPLTRVELPGSAADPIELHDGVGVELSATNDHAAERLGDKNLFIAEAETATDTMIAPTAAGVEVFEQLRSPESPEEFRFPFDLPQGAKVQEAAHGAEVLSASGDVLEEVPAPTAVDAQGSSVPVTMRIEGDSLVIDVLHRSADVAYPLLLDPRYNEGYESPPLNVSWIAHTTGPYGMAASSSSLLAYSQGNSVTYGANTYGQWEYTVGGETTYIENATFAPIYFYVNNCQTWNPHGYVGIYNEYSGKYSSLGIYANGNISAPGGFYAGSGSSGTRKAIVGIGTEGFSTSLKCAHEMWVGGATVRENDPEKPTIKSVTGVPSGWFDPAKAANVTVSATDPGMGVDLITIANSGAGGSEDHVGCTGMWNSRCPRDRNWTVAPPYKQGERQLLVSAEDPTGKVGEWSTTTKVDATKPLIELSGQLAYATEEDGIEGEENEASENKLSLPIYNLHVEATDGNEKVAIEKQSGMKSLEVLLDSVKQEVPWESLPSCPASSCKMKGDLPVKLIGLSAGEHKLLIRATDQVNLTREREIEFEYFPATGMKDEYVMQHFPLPDGEGNESEEEEDPKRPELAVNVTNGNLVYRQRDIEVTGPAVNLEVERFYNSQLPAEDSTEWGQGWTLGQTPELEPEETNEKEAPHTASMVRTSGALESAVGLPTEPEGERFDAKLQAVVTKEPSGGYTVADESGESNDTVAFNGAGKVTELRTPGYAKVNYSYEGGDLAEIAVEDPASAGGAMGDEAEKPLGPFVHSASFGGEPSGPGHLWRPFDLASDSEGNVWVADTAHNRIQEFDAEGKFVRQFGGFGSGDRQFKEPHGIAADAAGNTWVVDSRNNRIQKFGPKGEFISKFGSDGTGNGQFSEPFGIAIDPEGNLWISDSYNSRIQEFNAKGEFIRKFGSKGSGNSQFSFPEGVAADAKGNVWVGDMGNSRITEFNSKGEFIRKFGVWGSENGQFKRPSGVAVDPEGNVWVADSSNNRIQKFSSTGIYLGQFGAGGINDGQFFEPYGVTTDPAGNVWVADTYNNRVQEISGSEYLRQFGGEGPGQLSAPTDVAVDPQGNTWVADNGHNRIQEFGAKGEFLRQFGAAGSGDGQFYSPRSLATDLAGNVWVADTANSRVQEFNSKGEFIRKFGSYGTGNGQFAGLRGIAVDSKGNVWTVESGKIISRAQEFTSKGEFLRSFALELEVEEEAITVFPSGIAVDAEGNVWITDTGNDRIEEFNTEGENIRQIGEEDFEGGQFFEPQGVAVDPEGNVWVTDKANNRVAAFSSAGAYLFQFGTVGGNGGQFVEPQGLAADAGGGVWVADTGNNRVQEISGSEYLRQFGGDAFGPGHFSRPNAVAVDAEGNAWVADTGYNRVQEFDAEGKFVRMFGSLGAGDGQFYLPQGIAVDSQGHVWVSDTNHHRIEEFGAEGTFIRKFGSWGAGNGQLNVPTGIAVDAGGNVWVADTGNNRVQEFSAEGKFIRAFGSSGTGNGQFASPKGIAVDAGGNVWVADTGNNRVQEFSAEGKFIRAFGSKGEAAGQLISPAGISIDGEGNVLAIDTGNNRVEAFSSTGGYLSQLGTAGPNAEQLSGSTGVATDAKGDVWVADTGNSKLEEWSQAPPIEAEPTVEVSTPDGLVSSVKGAAAGEYDYQHEGALLTSAAGPQGATEYEYDEADRMTKVTLPNGTWGQIAYDAFGRVKSVSVSIEGGNAKITHFEYQEEPSRRTTVTPDKEAAATYEIGADGSVLQWWNAQKAPEIEELTGSLYVQRGEVHPEPITNGDQTLLVQAHSEEGVATIQVVANGSNVVSEKNCEQDFEKAGIECVNQSKEFVTNTANWTPGILQLEVVVTDRLGQSSSERFWDNIPYTPAPEAEAPDPPTYDEVLSFREEYGLDLDLKHNEFAINERIFSLLNAWHNPNTHLGEVARSAADRWGVPMRPEDVAEMQYREQYMAQAASVIPQWTDVHAPSAYAGYYVDQRQGGIIHVGFTSNQEALVAQLTADAGLIAPTRVSGFVVPPQHSLDELRDLTGDVIGELQQNSDIMARVSTYSLDVINNAVTAQATDVGAVASYLTKAFGSSAPITVTSADGRPVRTSARLREADHLLLAGDAITGPDKGQYWDCTLDFGAYEPIGKRPNGQSIFAHFAMTAGHCFEKGGNVERWARKNGKEVEFKMGTVRRRAYEKLVDGLETDVEAIRLEEETFAPPKWIYVSPYMQQKVTGEASVYTGETVCYSGTFGKSHCGAVKGPEIPNYSEGKPGWNIAVDWQPTREGDSGGPVWDLFTGRAVGNVTGARWFTPLLPIVGYSGAPGMLGAPDMGSLHVSH